MSCPESFTVFVQFWALSVISTLCDTCYIWSHCFVPNSFKIMPPIIDYLGLHYLSVWLDAVYLWAWEIPFAFSLIWALLVIDVFMTSERMQTTIPNVWVMETMVTYCELVAQILCTKESFQGAELTDPWLNKFIPKFCSIVFLCLTSSMYAFSLWAVHTWQTCIYIVRLRYLLKLYNWSMFL